MRYKIDIEVESWGLCYGPFVWHKYTHLEDGLYKYDFIWDVNKPEYKDWKDSLVLSWVGGDHTDRHYQRKCDFSKVVNELSNYLIELSKKKYPGICDGFGIIYKIFDDNGNIILEHSESLHDFIRDDINNILKQIKGYRKI